jgi:hypothetical protein
MVLLLVIPANRLSTAEGLVKREALYNSEAGHPVTSALDLVFSSACRCVSGNLPKSSNQERKPLDPCFRRGDGIVEAWLRRACPAFARMTSQAINNAHYVRPISPARRST